MLIEYGKYFLFRRYEYILRDTTAQRLVNEVTVRIRLGSGAKATGELSLPGSKCLVFVCKRLIHTVQC